MQMLLYTSSQTIKYFARRARNACETSAAPNIYLCARGAISFHERVSHARRVSNIQKPIKQEAQTRRESILSRIKFDEREKERIAPKKKMKEKKLFSGTNSN